MYATHQLAKYSLNPCEPHGDAALYLVQYLKKSCDLGIRFQPDPNKGFKCYCHADFSGLWNKQFARHDPSTAKSRSGWIVFYAGCPIIWASRLQTQVALSTTEGIHCDVSVSTRRSPHHVHHPGNERERLPIHLHATLCLLQSLQRQFWRFRARVTSEAAPSHQAYQRVLPPLSQTRAKWIDQDLSHWH